MSFATAIPTAIFPCTWPVATDAAFPRSATRMNGSRHTTSFCMGGIIDYDRGMGKMISSTIAADAVHMANFIVGTQT